MESIGFVQRQVQHGSGAEIERAQLGCGERAVEETRLIQATGEATAHRDSVGAGKGRTGDGLLSDLRAIAEHVQGRTVVGSRQVNPLMLRQILHHIKRPVTRYCLDCVIRARFRG